jgi:hypothetical protein
MDLHIDFAGFDALECDGINMGYGHRSSLVFLVVAPDGPAQPRNAAAPDRRSLRRASMPWKATT